jgi:site-specific DNA-methyltransferase (adenine-specific)
MTPYYERDGITIYCGETLEVMTYLYEALQLIFDAIMADLPYGTTACNWDTIIPFEPLWENYKRLVKDNGAVVLFGSQPFTSKLIMSNLEWFKYEWIWEKDNSGNFANAQRYPLKYHENILMFCSKTDFTYNPQKWDAGKVSNKCGSAPKNLASGRLKTYSSSFSKSTMRYPKSIMKFNRPNSMVDLMHPTQKPIDLLAYLIRTYTNPGEIILDNTMGSGTTLVAAQREGRKAVGIELDETYCAIAVDRLRQPSFFSIPDKPKEKPAEQLSLSLK